MLLIQSHTTNPYINIATEEYLLKSISEPVFFIYRNAPSIIIGKHQNALAEINYDFITKQNIPVIRRLSGGGTVFHDLGNINFCFIQTGPEGRLIDFKRYTQPIIDLLNQYGLKASLGQKNELLVHGLKFSGNAEHVFRNRVMHHGTILFLADLWQLEESIRVTSGRFIDKAVASNRSRVTNIGPLLSPPVSIEDFCEHLMTFVAEQNLSNANYELTDVDNQSINQLVEEKYHTWEWNFGYSPNYQLDHWVLLRGKNRRVIVSVEKGLITKVEIEQQPELSTQLTQLFNQCLHRQTELVQKINHPKNINISISAEDILTLFF